MRNDAGLHARTPRAGRSSSFFPNSIRAIFRNVSASASNLASTVRSAGSSVASTISLAEDERQREQVQWAGFDRLELGPSNIRHVLLLTYGNGFQVWDVEEADDVRELVSKRDGPVAFLRVQPQPSVETSDGGFKAVRPLLLVVTSDVTSCSNTGLPGGLVNGYGGVVGSPPSTGVNNFVPTVVKFYSLRSHTYVHTLRFRTAIYAIRCSPRVVAVALVSQLYCFDAATLQNTFSVLTYPSPQAGAGPYVGYGAVAVGPRWLAYAANQPLISNTGRVSPQHLTPSPGVSPSTSPANGSLVAHYAKESSKQIAAGIVTLGDMGIKTFSRYCSELLPEGAGSPVVGSPSWKNNCNGSGPHSHEPEHAGTVIVRDFVNKSVVAQFRAHGSPLSALCFDPSGTLLVTASINGHSINVFRIIPTSAGTGANSNALDANASHVHLYKLSRGVTNAVIQDLSFSEDSHWIVACSSRGTSHLFAISPFGGPVGPHTHGKVPVDRSAGAMVSMSLPWWSNMGPVKSTPQAPLPPPLTVNLSVISRIKNGNGGWRGTVSGAAAAASGRCSATGAVAVVFHDGCGQNLEAEVGQNSLKEQLWVLSPSGHLIRYVLSPSAGMEGSYSDTLNSGVVPGAHGSSKETLYLRVVVEPLQRWDVCRRPNWVDREEKMDSWNALDTAQDEAGNAGTSSLINGASMGCCFGTGRSGREEMTAEEMHQWFLSNAEVQMHHSRPPIWAKPQVSFHVFSGAASNELSEKADIGGEIEIEKVPARVVEVRKKDLVPVFDRLKNFQFVEGAKNLSVNDTWISSGIHLPVLRDDGMQDAFIGPNVGGVHIQRSSSGSSCGSEGSLYNGPNMGLNGFHHPYQDHSQYAQPSASFIYQTQQSQLHLGKAKLQSGNLSGSDFPKANKHVSTPPVIGSPPMDIPKLGHHDVYDMATRLGEKPRDSSPTGLDALQKRGMLPLNGTGEVAMVKPENGSDIPFACEGHIDICSSPRKYIARNGTFNSSNSGVISSCDLWDAPVLEETGLHSLQTQHNGDLNQASGRAANDITNHVVKNHLNDYEATTEDIESTDANSKSEDFEGGEQGEDAWEGAMFPFAEDC